MPERLLVLSERAAYMADLSRTLKAGDIVEGTVQKLTDYGAFVSIRAADGSQHGTDVRLDIPISLAFVTWFPLNLRQARCVDVPETARHHALAAGRCGAASSHCVDKLASCLLNGCVQGVEFSYFTLCLPCRHSSTRASCRGTE